MKETIQILLPMGFRMEDREERVSLWEAERRLLSGKRRCYTSATRQGEQVLLRSRWIRCPRCGEDFAANTDMFTEQGLLRPESGKNIFPGPLHLVNGTADGVQQSGTAPDVVDLIGHGRHLFQGQPVVDHQNLIVEEHRGN